MPEGGQQNTHSKHKLLSPSFPHHLQHLSVCHSSRCLSTANYELTTSHEPQTTTTIDNSPFGPCQTRPDPLIQRRGSLAESCLELCLRWEGRPHAFDRNQGTQARQGQATREDACELQGPSPPTCHCQCLTLVYLPSSRVHHTYPRPCTPDLKWCLWVCVGERQRGTQAGF